MIPKEDNIGSVILVRTLTGKIVLLPCVPQQTVCQLKERIEDKEGTPPFQQRLVFAGRTLDDYQTLQGCGIVHGSVVHLVYKIDHHGPDKCIFCAVREILPMITNVVSHQHAPMASESIRDFMNTRLRLVQGMVRSQPGLLAALQQLFLLCLRCKDTYPVELILAHHVACISKEFKGRNISYLWNSIQGDVSELLGYLHNSRCPICLGRLSASVEH